MQPLVNKSPCLLRRHFLKILFNIYAFITPACNMKCSLFFSNQNSDPNKITNIGGKSNKKLDFLVAN